MRLILIISLLLCCTTASFAQRVQSSCDAPDSLRKYYDEDAAWIAYQFEQQINSHYLDSVIINKDFKEKFMNALLAVYNAGQLPSVDTITKFTFSRDNGEAPSALHSFREYPLDKILFYLDTVVDWQKKLGSGILPTGNSALDTLISQNHILFDTIYYKVYGLNLAYWTALTHQTYNMKVLDSLMNSIANYSSFAQVALMCCGGDEIKGQLLNDSSVQLTYSFGWNDCFNGCISRRYWQFTVFPDCSVQFDSSYGNLFPNDAVFTSQSHSSDLYYYPNPASGTITIVTPLHNIIEILDLQGKVLQTLFSKAEKTELDVSAFPKGIYYVRVTHKNSKQSTAKFIKE